jgi:virulence-associated protein VagC
MHSIDIMKSRHIRLVREAGDSIAVTIPADFDIFKAGEEVWVELRGHEVVISKVVQ